MASQAITVPEGLTLHTENTSHILLASDEAFLNPVQEFNRDLSVACIRTWSECLNEEKENKWKESQERRAKRPENGSRAKKIKADNQATSSVGPTAANEPEHPPTNEAVAQAEPAVSEQASATTTRKVPEYRPQKITILEALSATGLRSIRYAKEIPLVKYVIANDASPAAVAAMQRNIDINGLGGPEQPATEETSQLAKAEEKPFPQPKVQINEGDACALMYNHRTEKSRVDVVDLDPYGTAAPFIDAAVQCVNDGGLLCVTCTDLAVLATLNYPEKCFSNYGGVPVKAEYCHEAALRLVLHTISTSAARYGRYIQPLLSLSIDFYVRLFVRVFSSPSEVKKAISKTSTYYICTGCQASYEQPLGRVVERVHEASGNVNLVFKASTGPTAPEKCTECSQSLHLAGPMWSGPLHDPAFVSKVLEHVEASEDKYGTSARMKGMLTIAKEELDTAFYFTPTKIAGHFHSTCPPLDEVASALLNAGHQVSRSHACAGSLKTTASWQDIHDVFRSWVKRNPVRMDKISENSPARHLLSKEMKAEANFKRHPQTVTASSKVKLVRYQANPTPNWGPGKRASGGKRKREQGDEE
ncbi:N2,N2-dimethylguanosine tRNA methyltransferase [Obba rivulosa]|uniref:tRNA (guanine(26)-N(2))-dimethyltransferase n=1 Tax=Obba rivulosa TaxID=1052685 RepID=A0A8E2DSN6_9APHY|nr:N2,N2-dimethylguanosine tRNA methyltransferase [Obba rivulosa]